MSPDRGRSTSGASRIPPSRTKRVLPGCLAGCLVLSTHAFPIVLLLLFASIFSKGTAATTKLAGGPIRTDAYFTAGIIAYAIMMACFSSLAIGLTTQREMGLLKRFPGTPVPAWTFVAARIVGSIVMVAVM